MWRQASSALTFGSSAAEIKQASTAVSKLISIVALARANDRAFVSRTRSLAVVAGARLIGRHANNDDPSARFRANVRCPLPGCRHQNIEYGRHITAVTSYPSGAILRKCRSCKLLPIENSGVNSMLSKVQPALNTCDEATRLLEKPVISNRRSHFEPEAWWQSVPGALTWLMNLLIESFAAYGEAMSPGYVQPVCTHAAHREESDEASQSGYSVYRSHQVRPQLPTKWHDTDLDDLLKTRQF